MTPVEFRGDLWLQKTRVPWRGVVCVILRLAVLVELRLLTDGLTDRQTDRQTDGQTDTGPWLVYRGCIASRGKNCLWLHSWFLLPTRDFCLDDGHVLQLLHHTTCNLSASWSMATGTGICSKPRSCHHFWTPGQFSANHCSVSDNFHRILYHQFYIINIHTRQNDSSPSRRIWKSPNLVVFGDHHAVTRASAGFWLGGQCSLAAWGKEILKIWLRNGAF